MTFPILDLPNLQRDIELIRTTKRLTSTTLRQKDISLYLWYHTKFGASDQKGYIRLLKRLTLNEREKD